MNSSTRVGMLTPSSNTVLEPVTGRLIAAMPEISAHYSRFRVTRIALDESGLQQFDMSPMLSASELLADAKVDVITWNGTSASWLGFDTDRKLATEIESATGIAATTCVLSYLDAFKALDVKKIGLVTPYTQDVQDKIVDNFSTAGISVVAEHHFDLSDNFSFALMTGDAVASAMKDTAKAKPDAIIVLCTNVDGASVAAQVENETGIPVLDSVVVTLWGALRRAGKNVSGLAPFGPALSRV